MGAPDTVEGRFELLTLHVIVLLEGLRAMGEEGAASSQAVFDAYVRDLDGALREMGVGDLTVGKRMRALGGVFYGRAAAYRKAFAALPDRAPLEALIGRTILADIPGAKPEALADYVVGCLAALADGPSLFTDDPAWPSL
jgi:cytochrome b pre-mRNA-processing protein 3